MKVVLLSSRDSGGGAAQAAFRLFRGLARQAMEPRMVVAEKKTRDPNILKINVSPARRHQRAKSQLWMAQHCLIDGDRSGITNSWFSLPYPGYDFSRTPVVRDADIVNLHWIAHLQSVESIGTLLRKGKPVVWTLHDENPFTGGCHYRAGCEEFTRDCFPCPQMREDPFHIPSSVLHNKLRRWHGNLHIVAPSRWMGETALRSRVFSHFPVHVIPNSLDTDLFRPGIRRSIRDRLGIRGDSTCILFTAESHAEDRKGFSQLLEALQAGGSNAEFNKRVRSGKIKLLTVGRKSRDLDRLGIPVHHFGYIHSEKKMASIYAAADFFIQPSLEDNLPNTVLEAMACGIPVIGFRAGGIPDMVAHEESGLLCPVGDTRALAEAITRLALEPMTRVRMGHEARRRVESRFQLTHQAQSYLDLFRQILGASRETGNGWASKRTVRIDNWRIEVDAALNPAIRAARNLYLKRRVQLWQNRVPDKMRASSPLQGRLLRKMGFSEERARRLKAEMFFRNGWLYERVAYPAMRRLWRFIKWVLR